MATSCVPAGGGPGVPAAGLAPPRAQLARRRRLAGDDDAAVRVSGADQALAQAARVAGIAEGEQVAQPHGPGVAASRGQPGDAQGGEQRILVAREERLEPGIDGRSIAPARRRDPEHAHLARRSVGRVGPRDPVLEQVSLEGARGVEQEDDEPVGLAFGPAGLGNRGDRGQRRRHPAILHPPAGARASHRVAGAASSRARIDARISSWRARVRG
jgi:hypothetical protein